MQISAEFLPRSWEMPPGARVLDESATVVAREFDGQKLDWLVALVEIPPEGKRVMWLRPLDFRFDAGFIVFYPHSGEAMSLSEDTEQFALRASLNTVWKNNHFARQFFLNENGDLRREDEAAHEAVLVMPNGIAAWSLAKSVKEAKHDDHEHQAPHFRWSAPQTNVEFLRLSAVELWKHLQELLAKPDGEALFARRFALLNTSERRRLLFDQSRGTDEEIKALLRARVHLQMRNSEVTPQPTELWVASGLTLDVNLVYWDIHSVNNSVISEDFVAEIRGLLDWFRPVTDRNLLNISCVAKWLQGARHFTIPIPYPTAHEQLEAQLRWRDWLAETEKL